MSFWINFDTEELELIYLKALAVSTGLTRNPWNFSRGAKTHRSYTDNGVERVRVEYSYKYNDFDFQSLNNSLVFSEQSGRFEDRRTYIESRERVLYLEDNGEVFHAFDVPISNDSNTVSRINREIRLGRISFLERSGVQLKDAHDKLPTQVSEDIIQFLISQRLIAPNITTVAEYNFFRDNLLRASIGVDTIFSYYAEEINNYTIREGGDTTFENALRNESDSEILSILNILTPGNSDFPQGLTIRQAISFQLLGVPNGL